MREIDRKIVGIVIESKDGKFLFGKRISSQSYANKWVVLGGGIEDNEIEEEAAKREALEECGIDISNFKLNKVSTGIKGVSEKTLRTGERVICNMDCTDFWVKLDQESDQIKLKYEDREFSDMRWFNKREIKNLDLSPISIELLTKIKLI